MSTIASPGSLPQEGTAAPGKARSHRGRSAIKGIISLAGGGNSGLVPGTVVGSRGDEHFLPVTTSALVDRLTNPQAWQPGVAADVRRFFRYLEYWRHQIHSAQLLRLQEAYEAFSPDSDLFVTRQYSDAERREMLAEVVNGVTELVTQANYMVVPRSRIAESILSKESHYGLDLKVDFGVFEEIVIAYRGESVTRANRRAISKFFRREEFNVEIYRRLVVLFKLKTVERHVEELMAERKITRDEAEKIVLRSREHIPEQLDPNCVYIKIFKNIPKSDIEMVFPNTEVKFRMKDKVWLGVTGGGALGAGVFGAAGKLALAFSNPVTAAGAVGGIGMVLFRQIMNVMNQKQRYMQVLAQNLYFHSMADNRGAMTKLAERASEEDFKEEILLYSVLAKEAVTRADMPDVDKAIEDYIEKTFGLDVDFDVSDALERLLADGIVTEGVDGVLRALGPAEAAAHIDTLWDRVLDMLPDDDMRRGREVERRHTPAANGKWHGEA